MKRKCVWKRFLVAVLASVMVFSSVELPAKAGAGAAIGQYAMSIAKRAFGGAVANATSELDPDSPIHTLTYLFLGIPQDKAAVLCKEILSDVEELNKEMNESKDYLSDMMNDLEEKESKDALTAYINNMTDASGEVTTSLWLEYQTYLVEAAEYADNPTQTNYDNMVNAGNILYDHMDKLYENHELTTMLDSYVGYASPYLPHIDPDDKKEQSNKQSYMDLLYDICGTQYLFDHQKHAVLTSAVNERIGTINQMMELQSVYVSHVLCEFESGVSDWTQSEIDALVYEFENNQQKAINAINDIAEEYGEEINHMVSYDDIHIALELDYELDGVITTQVRESGVGWTEDRDISYKSYAKSTKRWMNCYRVGVDGETFIFLKDPVKASDLVDETEVWYRQAVESDIWTKLRAESMDWYNLKRDIRREYECVSNLSQVYGVLKKNPAIYASYKNNFLALLREKGELTEVAGGGDAAYLFMNSKDIAKWDKLFAQIKGEAFINAKWGNLKNMTTDTNGFTSDSIVQSKNFCADDKNVLVMMVESEETELTYGITAIAQNGEIKVKEGKHNSYKPGDIIEIKLKPDENYTLDTLYVDGELYADTLNYESMPVDENGYVTYYFSMPYHSVDVKANFIRDVDKSYNFAIKSPKEVTYNAYDGKGNWMTFPSGVERIAFGEEVKVDIKSSSGTYISNIELRDTEGNTIQKLSALNKISFAMPNQDCTLLIECKDTGGGAGTLEDPYLIPDEATWKKYADLTAADNEQYKNAHYLVVNDITFSKTNGALSSAMKGFKLDKEGSLDGQGHILSNPYTLSALFTENKGEIRNLIVESASVVKDVMHALQYDDYVPRGAGIVLYNYGLVDHCIVKNSNFPLESHEGKATHAAGVVYQNYSGGVVRNSGLQNLTTRTLVASNVAGVVWGGSGRIENCYFTGVLAVESASGTAESAGGITCDTYDGVIDNCYVTSKVAPWLSEEVDMSGTAAIVPAKNHNTVTNCYVSEAATGYADYSNVTKKAESEMKSDKFRDQLNSNLKDGYLTWTRSSDENDGFPTFENNKYYRLTEEVNGSGSVVATRENGRPVSWTIAEGEIIHLQINAQDKYSSLKSLKVCKASDTSVVYKDFGATSESEVTFKMPAYDAVIIGEFTDSAEEYSIGVVQNGVGEVTVTDNKGKKAESAIAGEQISVKTVPGIEYELASIEVLGTGGNVIKKATTAETSFEMPADNCTIHITFEKGLVKYGVTAQIIGDGSGTLKLVDREGTEINGSVQPDKDVIVELYPAENSYPSKAVVLDADGKVIDTLIESYEDYLLNMNEDRSVKSGFVMPETNCIVQVTYNVTPALYDVKTELSGEGRLRIEEVSGLLIEASSPRKAQENTEIMITAIPEEGQEVLRAAVYNDAGEKLTDLKAIEGKNAETDERQYAYTIPAQNVTLKITFDKKEVLPDVEDEDDDGIYEIDSYEDLVLLAKQIQRNPEKYASASYEQTANIGCEMQEWALSIGTEDIPFNGTYEGNGYYILALRPTENVSGVFGVIGNNGTVKDLSVIDFDYSKSPSYAGGLAGINYGTIDGCGSGVNLTSAAMIFRKDQTEAVPITTLDSEIKATEVAGGLVAINEGVILNCRNNAEVMIDPGAEESYAGGIAGKNSGIIMNVYQNGTITGGTYAGGIAGTNTGYMQYGYNSSKVTGKIAGAIVGKTDNADVLDMFYEDLVDTPSGNLAEVKIQATKMRAAEMKTQEFADTLNDLVKGGNLLTWEYDKTKNAGYPKFGTDKAEENLMIGINRGEVGTLVKDPENPDGGDEDQKGDSNSAGNNTGNQTGSVETGDNSNIMLYVVVCMLSAAVLVIFSKKRRDRSNE